jgi:hypothetical protein
MLPDASVNVLVFIHVLQLSPELIVSVPVIRAEAILPRLQSGLPSYESSPTSNP